MTPSDHSSIDLPESWFKAGLQIYGVTEIVVFAALIPAVVFWFVSSEVVRVILPLFIVIPLLLGLRYGFLGGVIAALLASGVLMAVSWFQPDRLAKFPNEQAILFLLSGSIAGQFRDYWTSHFRRAHALSVYHKTRLAQFSSVFHLLQLSHIQLEQQLAGTTTSLRTSLQRLKKQFSTMEVDARIPLGGIGALLLDFLAETGNIHIASIYAINERGQLASEPTAMVGDAVKLSASHPLLLEALETGVVTSIHANDIGTGAIIAIVPLLDSSRHIHGVVSINAMPFISIHQRTFNLLGIIARQMGDILATRTDVRFGAQNNDQTLRGNLLSVFLNAHQDGLPVAVIIYKVMEKSISEQIVKLCLDANRGMDKSWLWRDRSGNSVVVNVLPMADKAAAYSQLHRLRQQIVEKFGNAVAAEGIQSYVWGVQPDQNTDEILEMICLTCDIEDLEFDQNVSQSVDIA